MITRNAYFRPALQWRMHLPLFLIFSLSFFFFIIYTPDALAQNDQENEEILVYVEIPRMGGFEIPAVIKGNQIYLSVADLFKFLKVKNSLSAGMDSVSGFFINPNETYLVDYISNRIRVEKRFYIVVKGDLIKTESNLYLKSDYFGRIFGLECIFNFRSLSVTINTKLELPLIREMRLAEMRKNLTQLKGEIKADTTIGRTHPLFRFGMADWSVYASEEIKGRTNASVNLSLGAMLLKGEATASLNYNNINNFKEKQQQYLWRYVDNDFKPLRQVMAGKIYTNAISTIYNPVIGVQLTNTPTTFRRSFGSYKLSDRTEPNWIVELYVNNVLVDYANADANGFFSFDVPLVYGNSIVKLKFYGPWGEERTKEQNINIPYNFLPAKTMEYNVSAGIVEDTLMSRYSRANINYGATKNITVGGGVEYLSSVKSGPAMPYLTTSVRILNNLMVAGEYTYGVRAKGALVYRLPSNMQFDLNYTWYEKGQTAINFNYREERKASFSLPLRIGKLASYQRFTLYQIILPNSKYTTGEWVFSGSLYGVNTNLSTYALIMGETLPYIYSNLSLSIRLPAKFTLLPQVQYGYNKNGLLSTKLRLEKIIGNSAFMHVQYERNFMNGINLAELGIRYDFAFGQTGLAVRQYNSRTTLIQYARGSVISDTKTAYVTADNRPNVGRGGITIIPYLDINSNGGRDPGEPRASGLNIRANGGRVIRNERDTTIRILGLEPYTSCFIELDDNGFENIAWRLPVRTLNVVVDPEILKIVEIPISVTGEATGNVLIEEKGQTKGLGRILLGFYNEYNEAAGRTLSEDDGYYSYLGLPSGEYIVRPDSAQLRKLSMSSTPEYRKFIIKADREGGYVSDLDFIVTKIIPDTTVVKEVKQLPVTEKPVVRPVKPTVKKDTTILVVHERVEQLFTIGEDSYAVQLGAFKKRSNAEALRKNLEILLGRKVEIVVENDFFKVRVADLKERKEVDDLVAILQKNGYNDLWVITLKARRQEWRLVQKTDTITGIKETSVNEIVPPDISIQLGAFRREKNATDLQKKLSVMINKPVVIVPEGGYYKVRVAGFSNMDELKKMIPVLRQLGMKDIWVPVVVDVQQIIQPVKQLADTEAKKPDIVKPAQVKTDTMIVKIDTIAVILNIPAIKPDTMVIVQDIPVIKTDTLDVKADTLAVKPVEIKVEEPVVEEQPVVATPKVSLHFGEFRKRSQALRAQRKVSGKFDVTVEIFMRYDSYHLAITGFYTQEETSPYFPELAGMGYTNIFVIKEK
jgi:cell division protein FtsN